MAALDPIAEKLRRCLRHLASDSEGEVVAAARALTRTLKGAGLDIHALADSIGAINGKTFNEEDLLEVYRRGVADGRREAEGEPTFHNVEHEEPTWHEIACECARHSGQLRGDRERQFVNDMVRRTVRSGELTEKQANWLRSIYTRVR
jgi:hypothetical protein